MKLSRSIKDKLARMACDAAYGSLIKSKERARLEVGDSIYDLVVDTYDLTPKFKALPDWAMGSISDMYISSKEVEVETGWGSLNVCFSGSKLWSRGYAPHFYREHQPELFDKPELLELIKSYLRAGEDVSGARNLYTKLFNELHEVLIPISTDTQLRKLLPTLHALYVEKVATVPGLGNLPVAQLKQLDDRLAILL